MTHSGPVEVHLSETALPRLVGVLRPSFQGPALASSSFEYDPSYLVDGYAVSPDLPLVAGRQWAPTSGTLFGAFSDAAPDEWGERIVLASTARSAAAAGQRVARLSEYDYLLGVADATRMGALRFRLPGQDDWLSSDEGTAGEHDLAQILAAARRYSAHEATDDDLAYLNDVATSPGGARPKANVRRANGRLAIAKLPHSKDGDFDVERWEAVALSLAASAGIRTPPFDLVSSENGAAVLLTDRFDRRIDGTRIGYISAATAMGLGTHQFGSDLTYLDLADTVSELTASPREQLHDLYARIALTIMVNNVDDHWKNHGLVRGAHGWQLSPVFDVNPSVHRGVITSRRISDSSHDRSISELLRVADGFQLRPPEAGILIARVARAVDDWPHVARRVGIGDREITAMSPAFDEEQRAVARDAAR